MADVNNPQLSQDSQKYLERARIKVQGYLSDFIFDASVLKDITLLLTALSRQPDPDPDPVVNSRLSMIFNHHIWQYWYYEGIPLAVRIAYWAAVEVGMLDVPDKYASQWNNFIAYLQESKAREIAFRRSYIAGGWLFPGEPQVLWEVARLASAIPGDFCELGTWTGRSATILCAAAQYFAPQKRVMLVDNWEWGHEKEIYPFMVEGRQILIELKHQLQPYSNVYKAFSGMVRDMREEVMAVMHKKGLALLHHDAQHDYENVYHDLESYLPLLGEGGYLVVHDYNHPDNTGTKKAVDDILNRSVQSLCRISIFNTIGLFRKGATCKGGDGLSSIGTSRTSPIEDL